MAYPAFLRGHKVSVLSSPRLAKLILKLVRVFSFAHDDAVQGGSAPELVDVHSQAPRQVALMVSI